MKFICSDCKKEHPPDSFEFRCSCNGLFQLKHEPGDPLLRGNLLGAIHTPVIPFKQNGVKIFLKLDYMTPTGSFKDRGAAFMIEALSRYGIKSVVEDSSGNAGASVAAYCARAGIDCRIIVPESTSSGKLKQILSYGAILEKVPGPRDNSQKRAFELARSTCYASHVFNPLFMEGISSMAAEIDAQTGGIDTIFAPVGNGTLLLGLYKGFSYMESRPTLMGVQAENCAPVYSREKGLEFSECGSTLAEGIAVGTPARMDEIIEAVHSTGGELVTVSESDVNAAWTALCRQGIYCEATSAAAVAAALSFASSPGQRGKMILVPITGSGLKK